MFQNITQIVKNKLFFIDSKRRRMAWCCSKKLSALLREIISKDHGNFYNLNCLHSFATENKRESHKNVCENKDFCNAAMPSEDSNLINIKNLIKQHLLFMQILNV